MKRSSKRFSTAGRRTLRGESWTAATTEWLNAAEECSLSQILEANAPAKYFLSPRACAGILRRAERRGKKLPPLLEQALKSVCESTEQGGAVSCKWAKGTGGPAGDEFYNLVATETVGTLCSDSHPGAYSGQDAYTGRLVPMKAKDSGSHWDDPSNPYPSLNQSNSGTGQVGYSNQEIFSQRGAYLVPGQPIGFNWANGGGYGNAHPGLGITEDDTPPLNCSTVPAVTCVTEERPKPTMAVRRLMPVETEKLQGFPRDWTSEGIDKQGRRIVMADSSRYKQMGNAVTVNVAEAIAHRVRAVLTEGD